MRLPPINFNLVNRINLFNIFSCRYLYLNNNIILLISLIIFSFIADSPEFLTLTYDEIMLLIKNEDLNAKENKVGFL